MNPCVVLGIDQAATSGAATLRPDGRLEAVSCPRVARDRLAVVRAAVALAGELGVPLVAVLEDHALSGRGCGKGRAERRRWSVASPRSRAGLHAPEVGTLAAMRARSSLLEVTNLRGRP